jgi:hypothetical protein
VQRGFLPRWLATFFGLFFALALTFTMLWIAYKPNVRSGADEQTVEAGATLAPSPTPSPVLTPAAPSEPAAPVAPQTTAGAGEEKQDTGSGGGGGAPAAPEKKKKTVKPVVPATDVVLRNTTTKKCADIPNYDKGTVDGPVRQYVCDESTHDNQRWNLEVKYPKGGPGSSPLFQIRNVKDQLCMDLPYYGAQPVRTPITEFTCDGTTADNQLWWIEKQPSGAYWIRNFASDNKCLDVAGYSAGGNDADLTLFDCSHTDDQEWQVVRTSGA